MLMVGECLQKDLRRIVLIDQVMVLKNLIGRHEAFKGQESDSIYS